MNTNDVFSKISEPEDIATFLVSYSATYFLFPFISDLNLNSVDVFANIPAGTFAAVASCGVIGLKKFMGMALLRPNKLKARRDALLNNKEFITSLYENEKIDVPIDLYNDVINSIELLSGFLDAGLVDFNSYDKLLSENVENKISELLNEIGKKSHPVNKESKPDNPPNTKRRYRRRVILDSK